MTIDASGAALAPAKLKFFPISIYRAMQNALLASALPAKLRGTAAALAAYADRKQPAKPITVQQQTLAAALGRDVRTVARHIAALVEAGWLIKAEQRRVGTITHRGRPFKSGRFAGCEVMLTEKAIAALGLAAVVASAPADPKPAAAANGKMSDGHTGSEKPLTTTNGQRNAGSVDKVGLPQELAWLHTDKGLNKPGIFALMKLANQNDQRAPHARNGRRLSDLVVVLRDYLTRFTEPKRLYGALRHFAKRNTDYAFAAQQLQAEQQQAEQGRAVAVQADVVRSAYAGKVLVSRDGRTTVHINGDGNSAQVVGPKGASSMPLYTVEQMKPLIDALNSGQLAVKPT